MRARTAVLGFSFGGPPNKGPGRAAADPPRASVSATATLAIGHSQTVQLFGADSARAADNHTVIIEFQVDDVDADYKRLKALIDDWVQEPTTMPRGNRSILLRDPDGNLVNLYTPVTEEAIERFSSRGQPTGPVS
jgi:catechol 2,3-dioxygenase-like lactoylglutathione lyase family enzyme